MTKTQMCYIGIVLVSICTITYQAGFEQGKIAQLNEVNKVLEGIATYNSYRIKF